MIELAWGPGVPSDLYSELRYKISENYFHSSYHGEFIRDYLKPPMDVVSTFARITFGSIEREWLDEHHPEVGE